MKKLILITTNLLLSIFCFGQILVNHVAGDTAALYAINGLANNTVVLLVGELDWGDIDPIYYRWNSSSTEADDYPNVIDPVQSGNGRYLRIWEGSIITQTGTMNMWATITAPIGWLLCDGSAISRTTYSNLFGVIGTTFGAGDGSTTFNLPDFRQRFPLGKSDSGTGDDIGDTGGEIDHDHTVTIPSENATVLLNLGQVGAEGSYTTSENNPPYLTVSFIIKY